MRPQHHLRKLTDEQEAEIVANKHKLSIVRLMDRYGVGEKVIRRIRGHVSKTSGGEPALPQKGLAEFEKLKINFR